MSNKILNATITLDDVINNLNDSNFIEKIKNEEKIETFSFTHENQFVIINLSSIENLINGKNEFVYSCFGILPSKNNIPTVFEKILSKNESILFSYFVIDLIDENKNLFKSISRFQLLSKLVDQKSNSLVESKNSLFQNFNHALNQGDSETALYLLERLSKYLSAKNLLSLKIKYFHNFRNWNDIMEIDGIVNLVKTSRTSKTTEAILHAIYFTLPEEVWTTSITEYVKENHGFNILDFIKPHIFLLKSDESLTLLKKILAENNQIELSDRVSENQSFNYFESKISIEKHIEEKDIKFLIEQEEFGLALDLIDLESDNYNDVYLQTLLALKIEDQDIKEEIFKNIISLDKQKRDQFLKEPAFRENFIKLQKTIYSEDEKQVTYKSWSELLLKLTEISYPIENLIEEKYLTWNEDLFDIKSKELLINAIKQTNNDKLVSFILPYITLGIIHSNEKFSNVNIAIELLKKINPTIITENNISGDIYDLYKLVINSGHIKSESLNELFFPHWNTGLKFNSNPIDVINFLNLYKSMYEDNYLLLLIKSDQELLHSWLSILNSQDQLMLIELLDYEYEIKIEKQFQKTGCECFEGKKIVLYSLDLNSVKMFKNEISKKCPNINIEFRDDLKGGSASLKKVVQTANVVFMVVAAAQHSATNFIEDSIVDSDLVKINRKGVTALRNAFQNWCLTQ